MKTLAFPLRIVACAATLTVFEVSLWLYEKQHSNSSSSQKTTPSRTTSAPTSLALPAGASAPKPKSERERAIDGFIRNYAERVSDGEYGHADYLATQVFRFNNMTDEEFAATFAN